MKLKIKKEDSDNENIFWITMTDLMTGLVLVFIVMFFYAYVSGNIKQFESAMEKDNAVKEISETLQRENIQAPVDPISGVVKISDLELFDLNSKTLSDKGKAYLNKFAPAYLNSVFKNDYMAKNVDKIIIQGHTDSQMYAGKYTEDEQYMKNMELSLERAFAVANYMINTPYNKSNGNSLRKMVVVEGASYSDPIIVNGKEDYNKSRRVELKLVMKNKQ